MERYRRYLRRATGNMLDGFAQLFLAKMLIHLLLHLVEDVVAFGPLVGEYGWNRRKRLEEQVGGLVEQRVRMRSMSK